MSALILDGRKTRDELLPGLIEKIKALSHVPALVIIQVGDRADSTSYIQGKKSFAAKIGITEKHIHLLETVSREEVIKIVQECNADHTITGIIVQLPLPIHIDRDAVINSIDPHKDADGLTPLNVKGWTDDREGAVIPATARGVLELLKHYKIDLFEKRVAIIGRSPLVGKPIAAVCTNEGAIVTVCHSGTIDLVKETKEADIIISAVGKQGLIGKKHVKRGQIIVDVGINKVNGKLVGDVDFDAVKDVIAAITPVPGGVGPMTVFALFENVVELAK